MTTLDAHIEVDRPGFRLDARLTIDAGEAVAVMGPSGAGKSTLLGVLAGLVPLGAGHVRLGERTLDSGPRPLVRTPPSRRGIVLLSQDPRLFPHLSARDTVAFGLRAHGASRADAAAAAGAWLSRVGLADAADRRPAELSGGQQQRVALARALATEPAALLLDEPLTSLDAETAGDVRALLHDQLVATGTTVIVATHDAVDAVALARRLVVLEDGRVTQTGAVRDVLARPATRFTAAVAGLNRVVGAVRHGRWRSGGLEFAAFDAPDSGTMAAVFRPGDVGIEAGGDSGVPNEDRGFGEWTARITRLEQTPAGVRIRTAEPEVAVDVSADRVAESGLAVGATVRLRVARDDVRFVPESSLPRPREDRRGASSGGGLDSPA